MIPVRCTKEVQGARCFRIEGHQSAHRFFDEDAAALWRFLAELRPLLVDADSTFGLVAHRKLDDETKAEAAALSWKLRAIHERLPSEKERDGSEEGS